MWNIKKKCETRRFCKVLFEALQAGSEDHDSENAHGCCSDKAAHSKFILASLAKKEVFVLMLSGSLNQTIKTKPLMFLTLSNWSFHF